MFEYKYSLEEIETFLEINLPALKAKREKYEQDRVLLRQLLANIDRNRMKLRQELLSGKSADALSSTHKVVIQSVKDKIDEQAVVLDQEEQQIKEKYDKYRIREESLRMLNQKLKMLRGDKEEVKIGLDEEIDRELEEFEQERRAGLMKELQRDYHKYLTIY